MLHRAGGKAVSLDELAARRKVTKAEAEDCRDPMPQPLVCLSH